jgi:hypothetical protein
VSWGNIVLSGISEEGWDPLRFKESGTAGNDDQNDSLFLQLTLISALRVIRLS